MKDSLMVRVRKAQKVAWFDIDNDGAIPEDAAILDALTTRAYSLWQTHRRDCRIMDRAVATKELRRLERRERGEAWVRKMGAKA